QHAREPDRQLLVAARVAERRDHPRREDDEERDQAPEAEQHQPEEARGDAPGALALALLEQLAEDRDEGRRECGVGHERADQVGDLERDGERVDLPLRAEVVRRDDLADEAENAGKPGGEREDRRRPREPPAAGRGCLVHGPEYRNALRRYRVATATIAG